MFLFFIFYFLFTVCLDYYYIILFIKCFNITVTATTAAMFLFFILGNLRISPSQVIMLGGDVLSISGPCFDASSDVFCQILGYTIQASYDFTQDPFTVRCSTPLFMSLGEVPVHLSKDGGQNYNYTGYIDVGRYYMQRLYQSSVGPRPGPPNLSNAQSCHLHCQVTLAAMRNIVKTDRDTVVVEWVILLVNPRWLMSKADRSCRVHDLIGY